MRRFTSGPKPLPRVRRYVSRRSDPSTRSPSRHAAVRRLHADDAAERRGLADRAAGVGAERKERLARRDRDRGPSRRPAGDAVRPPRVLHRAERGVLVRAAHGELVEVRLSDHHRARGVETLNHGRRVRRDVALEDARARGRDDALRADDVLARPRDARQRRGAAAPRPPPGEPFVHSARLRAGVILRDVKPRVVLIGAGARDRELGELERARLAAAQYSGGLADRARKRPHGRSPGTCCTRKNSPSRPPLGALAKTLSAARPGRTSSSRITLRTGRTEALGETSLVSTSLSRSTAPMTTCSCPVKRPTSSGVRAIRASAATFSTTERSMAMRRV